LAGNAYLLEIDGEGGVINLLTQQFQSRMLRVSYVQTSEPQRHETTNMKLQLWRGWWGCITIDLDLLA